MIPPLDLVGSAVIAATVSFSVSVVIVLTQRWHGKYSLDNDLSGIQKFHKRVVPRIGGIALFVGVFVALMCNVLNESLPMRLLESETLLVLLGASLPALLAGLAEDFTKRVSISTRLLATFASALLASWLLGATLPRLDTFGLDSLLAFAPFAIAVTAVAVAGVANSVNIIDGFHGVAGVAVVIMLFGLGAISLEAGDMYVVRLVLLGIGTAVGFLLVNYPTGSLFMGDGGAYFLGFWLAEAAVLLVLRNPAINAWQVLAVCAYPVIETIYSIYRRRVIRKSSPGAPDRLHLHTLIYRRVSCQYIARSDAHPWIRNAAVACMVGLLNAVMMLAAVLFGGSAPVALTIVAVDVLLYTTIYTRLVRGRWCLDPTVVLGLRSAPPVRELP